MILFAYMSDISLFFPIINRERMMTQAKNSKKPIGKNKIV